MTDTPERPAAPAASEEDPGPDPGRLGLVRDFVNTFDVETGVEDLGAPESLAAWLREHGLPGARGSPGDADLVRARAVREALRHLMGANAGEPIPPEAIATLNEASSDARFELLFETDGSARLVPSSAGVDAAMGVLLTIVEDAMADGTWARMKACKRDSCRWAYYDHSRNRSRAWCAMSVCGNREKARSYRERHSAESSRG